MKRALAIQEKKAPDSHDMSRTCHAIGSTLHDHHDYHEALAYLKKSVDIREKLDKVNPLDLSRSYYLMGRVYDGLGNYPAAVEYFQKAIETRQECENSGAFMHIYHSLGLAAAQCARRQ
jgi:tetratricopeptide (TPR) repeat protein